MGDYRGLTKMTYNRVRAIGVTGIFKNQDIEIDIGATGHDTKIKVNGKEIHNVAGCWIKMLPDKITTVTLDMEVRK